MIRTELVLLGLTLSLTGCATTIAGRHSTAATPGKGIYDALPLTAAEDGIGLALDTFTPGLYADTEFAKRQYAPETLETKPSKGYFIPGGPIELNIRYSGVLSQGPVKVVDRTAEVVDTAIETSIAALTAVAGIERKAGGGLSSANACLNWMGRDLEACHVYEEIVSFKVARTTLASGEVTPSSLTGAVLDKTLKVLNDDIDYREKQYFRGIHNSKTFYFSQAASKPSTPDSLNSAKDPGIGAGRK